MLTMYWPGYENFCLVLCRVSCLFSLLVFDVADHKQWSIIMLWCASHGHASDSVTKVTYIFDDTKSFLFFIWYCLSHHSQVTGFGVMFYNILYVHNHNIQFDYCRKTRMFFICNISTAWINLTEGNSSVANFSNSNLPSCHQKNYS